VKALWLGLLLAASAGLVGLVFAVLRAPVPPSPPVPAPHVFSCERLQARCRQCRGELAREVRGYAATVFDETGTDLRRQADTLLQGALGSDLIQQRCELFFSDPTFRPLADALTICWRASTCDGFARCLRRLLEGLAAGG
jgi:hypothetical protein